VRTGWRLIIWVNGSAQVRRAVVGFLGEIAVSVDAADVLGVLVLPQN
jgi:hypothetical protein